MRSLAAEEEIQTPDRFGLPAVRILTTAHSDDGRRLRERIVGFLATGLAFVELALISP